MIIQSYYKSSGADLNLQILMHNIKTDIENINKYLEDHSLEDRSLDSYFPKFPEKKKENIKKWINELREKNPKIQINMDYIELLTPHRHQVPPPDYLEELGMEFEA